MGGFKTKTSKSNAIVTGVALLGYLSVATIWAAWEYNLGPECQPEQYQVICSTKGDRYGPK